MLGEVREIVKQLNTPGDVAVVGGAGLIGFALDAAINIIPIPIFSPGVCGVSAASAALVVKRSIEARLESRRNRENAEKAADRDQRLLLLTMEQATRLQERLRQAGKIGLADRIDFQARAAEITGDPRELRAAIEYILESEFGQSQSTE